LSEAVRTTTLWDRHSLAVEPSQRFFRRFELRCVRPYHEIVALLVLKARYRDHADIRLAAFGRRNDRRHIADVTELIFPGEHVIGDDGALETDFPTYGTADR
jgi:hypothetical protein